MLTVSQMLDQQPKALGINAGMMDEDEGIKVPWRGSPNRSKWRERQDEGPPE